MISASEVVFWWLYAVNYGKSSVFVGSALPCSRCWSLRRWMKKVRPQRWCGRWPRTPQARVLFVPTQMAGHLAYHSSYLLSIPAFFKKNTVHHCRQTNWHSKGEFQASLLILDRVLHSDFSRPCVYSWKAFVGHCQVSRLAPPPGSISELLDSWISEFRSSFIIEGYY